MNGKSWRPKNTTVTGATTFKGDPENNVLVTQAEAAVGPHKGGLDDDPNVYDHTNIPYRGNEDHGLPIEPFKQDEETIGAGGSVMDDDWFGGQAVPVTLTNNDPLSITGTVKTDEASTNKYIPKQIPISASSGVVILAPRDTSRKSIRIKNTHATNILYIGNDEANATNASGYPISPGESLPMTTCYAIYASVSGDLVAATISELRSL